MPRDVTDEWTGGDYTDEHDGYGDTSPGEVVEEVSERRTYGPVNRFFHQYLGGSPVDWLHRTRDRFRGAFDVIGDDSILGPVARDAEADKALGTTLFASADDTSLPARVRQACAGAAKLTERNIGTIAYVDALGILAGFQEAFKEAREFRGDAVDSAANDAFALQRVIDEIERAYGDLDESEWPDNVRELADRCHTNLHQNVGVGPELKRLASAEKRITSGGGPINAWHIAAAALGASAISFAAFEMGSRSHAEHGVHPSERIVSVFTDDVLPEASASGTTNVQPASAHTAEVSE